MSSILPKNELENVNFCPSLLGQKFFVRFLGELKKPKSPFEINWPLTDTTKSDYFPVLNCLLTSFGLWSEANLSFSFFSSESKWKYFFEQNERMRNCVKFFKIIGFNWEKKNQSSTCLICFLLLRLKNLQLKNLFHHWP